MKMSLPSAPAVAGDPLTMMAMASADAELLVARLVTQVDQAKGLVQSLSSPHDRNELSGICAMLRQVRALVDGPPGLNSMLSHLRRRIGEPSPGGLLPPSYSEREGEPSFFSLLEASRDRISLASDLLDEAGPRLARLTEALETCPWNVTRPRLAA